MRLSRIVEMFYRDNFFSQYNCRRVTYLSYPVELGAGNREAGSREPWSRKPWSPGAGSRKTMKTTFRVSRYTNTNASMHLIENSLCHFLESSLFFSMNSKKWDDNGHSNADRTTRKLTLQDINTTPKELKTERDCSHTELFRPLWGSSVWRNNQRKLW